MRQLLILRRASNRTPSERSSPAGLFTPSPRANMITTHTVQGRDVQLDYGTEWIRKVEYFGRNMFRVRHNEHEHRSRSEPPGASYEVLSILGTDHTI
jgi:hypothetical protein